MKATVLLLELLHNGVQVWVEGGELCFQATKGVLAPAPREELNRRQRLATILGGQDSYCSPLGPVLRAIRATRADSNRGRIGVRSIRRLEEAGIRSIDDLLIEPDDMVRLGIR